MIHLGILQLGGKVVNENYARFLIHILIKSLQIKITYLIKTKSMYFWEGIILLKLQSIFFFRLKLETKLAGIIKSYTQLHHAVYKTGKDCMYHSFWNTQTAVLYNILWLPSQVLCYQQWCKEYTRHRERLSNSDTHILEQTVIRYINDPGNIHIVFSFNLHNDLKSKMYNNLVFEAGQTED